MNSPKHPDWALIVNLGGPVKVAEMLGYAKSGGVQRVQNWKLRGIPPAVKLANPDLFMPEWTPPLPAAMKPASKPKQRRKPSKPPRKSA